MHKLEPPIVHRDVKCANVLLDGDERARLADLRLARDVDVGSTMAHCAAIGTPGYIDPEYQRLFEVSPALDLFSFGVVLLELLTGQPAFDRAKRPPMLHERASALVSDVASHADARAGFAPTEAVALGALALRCVAPTADARPPLAEVRHLSALS